MPLSEEIQPVVDTNVLFARLSLWIYWKVPSNVIGDKLFAKTEWVARPTFRVQTDSVLISGNVCRK